jgi:oxygen-independent coproporphyrinogen-3 oxidase
VDYQRLVPTQSLYLHWPFCLYKCHFCPFVALAAHDQYMDVYHLALCEEIKKFAAAGTESIDTIYLGGGTPSTYPSHLLLDTFGILKESFNFSPNIEVTLEVNPGTVTQERLLAWSKAGINRLSVGVQSLNDKVLKDLNRHQAARDVEQLMQAASPLFENISVDLILGLPGIADDEWKSYLSHVVSWPIKHLSMYFLTVHENTPLYFGVKQQKFLLPPDDAVVALYEWSVAFLAGHGFEQYEISNFARPGFASKHNSVYWQRKPYKGFGLGACSFDGYSRFQNDKNLLSYLKKATERQPLVVFKEELTAEQIRLETCMLNMRLRSGFDVRKFLDESSPVARKAVYELLHDMYAQGYITLDGSIVTMTARGLSVENELVVRLSDMCAQ